MKVVPVGVPQSAEYDDDGNRVESVEVERQYVQWDVDGKIATPMRELNLKRELAPGYYEPRAIPGGLYLEKIDVRLDGLVDFGNGVASQVVDQIDRFWKAEPKFRKVNKHIKVLYKRGILLYGPPGCGKSSMISVVMRDIIAQGGIALLYSGTSLTTHFIKIIREIQPNMKILVVIEDLDGIVRSGEEDLLNMLDGVDTTLDSVIFLATTNYFHSLSTRLLRPSRFDLKIEMDYPSATLRKKYLQDLLKSYDGKVKMDLTQAVKDTERFSFADLKELFISSCLFEYSYQECLKSLKMALYTEEKKSSSKMREFQMKAATQMIGKMLGGKR